jgi:transcriptional regulator with XRE-family HTH domain
MAVNNGNVASTHFGRQMRKERLAHGWTLREFNARTGIDVGQASRIETGRQPPTEKVADACDRVYPERRGWFREYYEESKSWVPAGFRSWAEYEDKAATVRVWAPTIVHGLLETENYARIMLSVYPGVSDQVVKARLASRMQRQQRVLFRADPPDVHVIVDEAALYRRVGSAEVMAEQMSHLLELAALDHVRLQVMPAVEHPCNVSEMIIADDAAYTESLAGGGTYTGPEMVARLSRLFATLAGECYRVSESRMIIERMRDTWIAFGGRARTQAVTAVAASRSARTA